MAKKGRKAVNRNVVMEHCTINELRALNETPGRHLIFNDKK